MDPATAMVVSGIGSSILGPVTSKLLGGSQPDPGEMAEAMIDAQEDSTQDAAKALIAAAQEALQRYTDGIEELKQDYVTPTTKEEFRTQIFPELYKNLQLKVSEFKGDPELEWDKIETAAIKSGLTPSDVVRIPGQGRYTLSTLGSMMKLESDKTAPERWNTALRDLFADNFERNPTKQEADWYSYGRFKSMDEVMADLGQRNPDFYNQNIEKLNPSQAYLNAFLSGRTSLPTTSTPGYERIDPSEISYHGYKPPKATTSSASASTKTSSSRPPQGIDTSNPRPRGFEGSDKKSKASGYADFS